MSADLALAPASFAVDARSARSRQKKVGPSQLGTCRRAVGYEVAGVPKTDPAGSHMSAVLGNWLHKGALDVLRREYEAVIEVKVENELLRGKADAVYPEARLLDDLKTRSHFAFQSTVDRGRPRRRELFQTHVYAYLLREGLVTDRRLLGQRVPIERIRLRYLNRSDGAEWIHEQDYDPAVTTEALAWYTEVLEVALGPHGPDDLPRDEDGPGLSWLCDACPFRTRCWGPQPAGAAMRQSNLVRTDADVEAALVEYGKARDLESEARALKELARAKLTGSPAGVYGPWKLGWSGGGIGDPTVDRDALVKLCAAYGVRVRKPTSDAAVARALVQLLDVAGVQVPTQPGKPSNPSISVGRAG